MIKKKQKLSYKEMRYAISATKAVGEDLSLNSGMTVILHAAQPLAVFPALPEASVTYG